MSPLRQTIQMKLSANIGSQIIAREKMQSGTMKSNGKANRKIMMHELFVPDDLATILREETDWE